MISFYSEQGTNKSSKSQYLLIQHFANTNVKEQKWKQKRKAISWLRWKNLSRFEVLTVEEYLIGCPLEESPDKLGLTQNKYKQTLEQKRREEKRSKAFSLYFYLFLSVGDYWGDLRRESACGYSLFAKQ